MDFGSDCLKAQMAQSLTLTELESPIQKNDNVTDNRQNIDITDDRLKYSCDKKDEAILFFGTHETQVSEGGEAELHTLLVDCKKNPGHSQFIPVYDFNINHMAKDYHDDGIVEWIKSTADVTVRIRVQMTSTERPEFFPNTKVPYAFYSMRGSVVMRVATGKVLFVNKWTEADGKGTCPCHTCQHTTTPSKVWGEVWMSTATHVVFDNTEARHTTCRLFYDRPDSPLVTLDGWTVDEANIEDDKCWMKCSTCDVDLLDRLDKMVKRWAVLREKVNNRYKSSRDEVNLIFIVSHPHGCPKQVCLGQRINRYEVRECRTKYTYTTCTCPGSSGAYVHSLGYDWFYYDHVHSGVNFEGTNFSGAGYD